MNSEKKPKYTKKYGTEGVIAMSYAMEIISDPNFQGIPMYGPEGDGSNCLILQCALISAQSHDEEIN